MFEQSEKAGDWAFWDSSTNTSISMDMIRCVGDGTMRTTVRLANPRGSLRFLKGVECGSVSVTCGTETSMYNLYEDPTVGNVVDVPCSLRYKRAADILCVSLGVAVFILWLVFSAFCLRRGTGKTVVSREKTGSHQPGPDLIRVYAVAAVAFIHGLSAGQYYTIDLVGVTGFLTTVLRWGLFPCVVLFFMLSGFFLRKKKLSVQWYRRLASLIVTYLVATGMCVFTQRFLGGGAVSPSEWWRSARLYEYSGFLSQYVWLCLLIPFLNVCWNGLKDRDKQVLCITCIVITGLSPSIKAFIPQLFLETYPVTFYFLGAYIAEKRPWFYKKRLGTFLVAWLMMLTAASISFSKGGQFSWAFQTASGLGYQSFSNLMVATLLFLLMYDIEIHNAAIKGILAGISALSFEIYLFGQLTDSILWSNAQRWSLDFQQLIKVYPLVCTLSLIFSFLLGWIYKFCAKQVTSLVTRCFTK